MTWAGVRGLIWNCLCCAIRPKRAGHWAVWHNICCIPSSQIAPFAAYGGASKAADTLSAYYVKRAEQYPPVIQVGSGNVDTVLFKNGFYLEPDEDKSQHAMNQVKAQQESQELIAPQDENPTSEMNFTGPPEVLGKIDRLNTLGRNETGVTMRRHALGLITILSAFLTGCGTMNSNFSCNVTADSCLTIEQVDAMTRFAYDVKPNSARRGMIKPENNIPNHQGKIIQQNNGQSLWVSRNLKEQSWA